LAKIGAVAVDKRLNNDDRDRFVPDFTTDPVRHFVYGEYPLVQVGDVYGYACGYTREYVNVQWQDEDDVRVAWFPAAQVQRVDQDVWHGRPLMF
jgi:hypothetical protein